MMASRAAVPEVINQGMGARPFGVYVVEIVPDPVLVQARPQDASTLYGAGDPQ